MQRHYSSKLMRHGFAGILVSLVTGFILIFAMLGGASLSPIPILIEFDVPGTVQGWRTVHIGMMMNGIMAVALACAMRTVYLNETQAFRVFGGTVLAVWANFMFYFFGMFAPNHGLTLEANALGEASMAGALAFFPALLGAITLFYAVFCMLRAEPSD
ncbi:Styrene-oxide isomerase [Zhongshania aliphaticivorans]|uniref:Styrene-oxide isomerase n=1 Tax=Zhongshania aliphaticivorans TaxID=1470434 RepID=A0A5S9NQ63_9GAMM|nr:hypothetical protein [Zhongshania aliphaticivorans]CAA0092540.1 Styrene-oxide isomerase [Zhongshania aliphaticivorans]CAA0109839.1 Styrene-oxide isomerase [Zhongshania aliphaticivorans]